MRRVLIDECLPVQLHAWLHPAEARTVEFMGWKGLPDEALLTVAAQAFDVVLSGDGGLVTIRDRVAPLLAVVLRPLTSCQRAYRLVPTIKTAIRDIAPGEVVTLDLHQ